MRIPEDSAVYLAERLRQDYDIEGPAERPHFVSITADRGIAYVIDETLPRSGSCFVLLQDGRAACIISGQAQRLDEAHETCHGVTERLAEDGVDFPDLVAEDPERVVCRMAEVLAGPDPPREPSEALRGFELREPAHAHAPIPWHPPPDPPEPEWEQEPPELLPYHTLFLWPRSRVPSARREVFRGTCRRPR